MESWQGCTDRAVKKKKRKDIKDQTEEAVRGQNTKGFVRNIKESEFYSKYYGKPLKNLM